jgi:hypothetical protein
MTAMKAKLIICCLLSLLSCELAFGGYYDLNYSWAGFGWGGYYQPGYTYNVPYFAMHPPVYYSYQVPRTYGDSPFPNPPGSPGFQDYSPSAQPQIIKNEHVEEASSAADQQSQNRQPLRISNPFVEQSDSTSAAKDAKWEARKVSKPLTVYPASLVR